MNRTGKQKKSKTKQGLFSSLLKSDQSTHIHSPLAAGEVDREITREQLSDLIDEMHDLGKKMAATKSMKDLMNYKKAIKEFLTFFVRNSMNREQITSRNPFRLNPGGGQKQYTIVKTIDSKLENLAAAVLSNHLDNLEILKKTEEIRGLMVDLIA